MRWWWQKQTEKVSGLHICETLSGSAAAWRQNHCWLAHPCWSGSMVEVYQPLVRGAVQAAWWGSAGRLLHPGETPPDQRVTCHDADAQTCRAKNNRVFAGACGIKHESISVACWGNTTYKYWSKCSINLGDKRAEKKPCTLKRFKTNLIQ